MFRTSVNRFNVVDATPWNHDPLADLSAAARAAGLHFGVYYSILINNRVAKLQSDGDFDTPEQVIPDSEPPGRPWETAQTRSMITAVTIRGRSAGAFSDSQIAAWDLGAVSLGRIRLDNRGASFGVAAHRVRVLRAVISSQQSLFRDLTAPAGPISLGGDTTARLV